MAHSIGHIARDLMNPDKNVDSTVASREARDKNNARNANTSSSGSSTSTSSSSGGTKPKFTKADLVAFNKLPDDVRKASKKKIAAFQAAGIGVFEDFSVHTSGKGFGKFFDKTSPKYKNR